MKKISVMFFIISFLHSIIYIQRVKLSQNDLTKTGFFSLVSYLGVVANISGCKSTMPSLVSSMVLRDSSHASFDFIWGCMNFNFLDNINGRSGRSKGAETQEQIWTFTTFVNSYQNYLKHLKILFSWHIKDLKLCFMTWQRTQIIWLMKCPKTEIMAHNMSKKSKTHHTNQGSQAKSNNSKHIILQEKISVM